MKNIDIEHGLDLLIHYNKNILGYLRQVTPHNAEFFLSALEERIPELLMLFNDEERLLSLIKALDENVSKELSGDLAELKRYVISIDGIIKHVKSRGSLESKIIEQLREIEVRSEHILQKQVYIEEYERALLKETRHMWELNIKGKYAWAFHGTSILFLPYIQKYGLDPSRLPSGIQKGLERISQIIRKYHISVNTMDYQSIGEQPIYLTFKEDVLKAATAVNLPAFMYEFFDKEFVLKGLDTKKLEDLLSPEDLKMCRIIWRFGSMLRRRNKMVVLRIKIDSSLLKRLGLPDIISDYDAFFSEYAKEIMEYEENIPLHERKQELSSLKYISQDVETVLNYKGMYARDKRWEDVFDVVSLSEFRIKKSIPPPFIYMQMHNAENGIVNISQWNEKLTPYL